MKTPKVVFDTNIYVSGIIYGGVPRVCLDLAREGEIAVFTSNALLLELAQVLGGKFEWNQHKIHTTIRGLSKFVEVVRPSFEVYSIKKDESDNKVLEIAKQVCADYIISGDKKHILSLKKFEKTKILSAADFVKLHGGSKD